MNVLTPFPKSVWGLFLIFYFCQIQTVTDNRGNRDGARELLSRIVQKKDWFSSFLIALRETQHEDLADDLSGNTGGNHIISLVQMCGFLISLLSFFCLLFFFFFVLLLKKQCRIPTILFYWDTGTNAFDFPGISKSSYVAFKYWKSLFSSYN